MRKLLLASVATLGATFALTGGAKAQPVKPVAPGTLVVHFNGYLQFELGDEGSSYNKITIPSTSTTTTPGTYKLSPVTTIGDFRLYPGFDAQTADGIEYGVATDIRTGYSNAGVGQNGKTTVTSTTTSTTSTVGKTTFTTTSSNSSLSTLYVKRAYGYLGTSQFGYVRFGQTDSAFTLLQSGVVEAFGDGGQWTLEGGEAVMLPSNSVPYGGNQFIYADQSQVYATSKVVYVSPSIFGLNAVIGYEPNSNGTKEGYQTDGSATSTSANLSSSPVSSDIGTRRRNTIDGGIQYLDTLAGFKIKASGVLYHSAPVSYTGATALAVAPYGYDSMTAYQFGGQATFAGLTLGANLKGGSLEDGYAFKPKGGRDGLAYIIGASYVIGPYVIGASYLNSQSNGAYVPGGKGVARTLSEYGFAVGGNYVISPNISLFTQYMYGHRHQPGNSSLELAEGASKRGDTQGQVIAIGATLKW
jgi:hypothetical protein